jgi:hypothetical protein
MNPGSFGCTHSSPWNFVSVNNDAVETEPRLSPLQRHGCAYAGLAGLGFQRLGSTSLTS